MHAYRFYFLSYRYEAPLGLANNPWLVLNLRKFREIAQEVGEHCKAVALSAFSIKPYISGIFLRVFLFDYFLISLICETSVGLNVMIRSRCHVRLVV